jgi:single-strand DNA-binding protein
MPNFSSFHVIGNLTADPEMRYTPSGSPICTFTVAINSKRKDGDGNAVDHVDFFRMTTKFKLADVCMKHLKKGRSVFVTGEMESWRNNDKFGINFLANNVQFLGSPRGGTAADEGQEGAALGQPQGDGAPDGWTPEMREFVQQMD